MRSYGIWFSLPGDHCSHKPHSYQSEEFDMISKTRVTNICEDKFGAQKKHDGEKRSHFRHKSHTKASE